MRRFRTLLTAALLTAALPVVAEPSDTARADVVRPVASIFTAEWGHASLLDTYLTPICYGGTHVGLGYSATQATGFSPLRWVRQLAADITYDHTGNSAGNHTMHALLLEGRWSIMRRWAGVLHPRLQLMAGATTQLGGGLLYNAANSNNMVSAKAYWSVGAAAMATFGTRLGKVPVALGYQLNLPLVGVFFTPDFGEPYYEIYLGNHDGLARFGYPGNRLDMDHLLWADLRLGGTVLRLGYHFRLRQSWVNRLDYRHVTHALVIGVGGDFTSFGSRRPAAEPTIVSSLYYPPL